MNIPPDLYEHLTNYADDETILNMLSVNRKFNDDVFFKRILTRRYPCLISYKQPNESYKQLYLRMIYAIAKLKEEYDIPYVSNPKFNPIELYQRIEDNLNRAYLGGSMMFDPYQYTQVGIYAAEIGDLDTVKRMLKKGADQAAIIAYAAEAGQMGIVKYMVEEIGVNDLNRAMSNAGRMGYLDIVKYLVSKGADDFDYLLYGAVEGKQCDIIKYAINKSISEYAIDIIFEDRSLDPNITKCINDAYNS